jgi:hypothetical protein
MIGINRAILHILDFNSNLTVFSEQELELGMVAVAALSDEASGALVY